MILNKKRIRGIVNEVIQRMIFEDSSQGDDITGELRQYIELSIKAEFGDAESSKRACQMHRDIMDKIYLEHEEEYDRKCFARILTLIKPYLKKGREYRLVPTGGGITVQKQINGEYKDIVTYYATDENGVNTNSEPILFSTEEGIVVDEWETTYNTSDGGMARSAVHGHMTEEMYNKIKSMGLIPAISVDYSCHWSWIYAVGVEPSLKHVVDKDNEEDDYWKPYINFDCKF